MTVSLSLAPPPQGTTLEVPLGQEQSFIFSGALLQEEVLEISNLSVTLRADGRTFNADVDALNSSYTAAVTLRSPSAPSVVATLHARHWVETQRHGHWAYITARSEALNLVVQDTTTDPAYLIVCRCVDGNGRALPDLDVQAFDRDPRSPDDRLGDPAKTGPDGLVEFRFRRSNFTEHPGERHPDVYFRIFDRGSPLSYEVPGERNDNGMLRNFIPRPQPVTVLVLGARGFIVHGAIREKWLRLGAHAGFLGRPTTDELPTPDGRGRFNHFEGGSIYWTAEWGASEVHGLIRAKWAELNWEQGFLGFPVTDELALPGHEGGRYNVFEHGVITWLPGQSEALAGPHHYERIYANVRAHILSRFYAIGPKGRRNHLSRENRLQGPVSGSDPQQAEQARWRIVASGGENPWMGGAWVHLAVAIENAAGNAESGRVLQATLNTLDSLMSWGEPGHEADSRVPQRWDAGMPEGGAAEGDQFLAGETGDYAGAMASADLYHYARRSNATLDKLLGPTGAGLYRSQHEDYWQRYRRWELSMDELVGLVTSCWAIGKLATTADIQTTIARQTAQVGNYLADHGYLLVRPMGALSWRGSTGMLPAMEWPIARALSASSGSDFRSRTDFRGAMQRAGYWQMLEGEVAAWQALGWGAAVLLPLLGGPLAVGLGVATAGLEAIVASQVLSPGTLAAAYAVYLHRDCFDVAGTEGANDEQSEPALALLCKDAPNKAALYNTVATQQAQFASFRSWSVNFHSWLGLTGLDDADPTVRNTFSEWFARRQAMDYEKEPKGQGSRSLFASGVAALVNDDDASEQRLVRVLEHAIVELFRNNYFDPQLPVVEIAGNATEYCLFPHWNYESDPRTPYGPLDFMVACALAFWHARRRQEAGRPVSTERFPQALDAARFDTWPRVAVPNQRCLDAMTEAGIPVEAVQGNSMPMIGSGGFALFDPPVVARRRAPAAATLTPATEGMCDVTVVVKATDTGDVATGITLLKDHEIQIEASGDIWAGGLLDGRNGPNGLPRMINDARWPLHTGIDPAANACCLLGRLNGYFRIGTGLPRTRWRYHQERPLFLRINDDGLGDGDGQFNVRIRVWGPIGADPAQVFRPPNVVRTGGVLHTIEAADLIEVSVEPGAVEPDVVEFVLTTADAVSWRKEILIREGSASGTGTWTIWTADAKRWDANGLYRYQLQGATLEFRKMRFLGGMWSMVTLGNLDAAPAGARIRFNWVRD